MFDNKCLDVDDADNIIIDGVWYAGLYELIFKRISDDLQHGKWYEQVQEHAGDERAKQIQASFAGPIIE